MRFIVPPSQPELPAAALAAPHLCSGFRALGWPGGLVPFADPVCLRERCDRHGVALPTLRTLGGHVLVVICNGCQHAAEADQAALIAAGRGDVPVIELRFRCGACGSRNCSVVVSGARISRQD